MNYLQYVEIFCGLVEPFPRLRTLETWTSPFPMTEKEHNDYRVELLALTRSERDYYKKKFNEARSACFPREEVS